MDDADPTPLWRVITGLLSQITGGAIVAGCLVYFLLAWATGPDWTPVNGRVISTSIDASTHTRQRFGRYNRGTYQDTRYDVDIHYAYTVGGRDYEGHGIGDGLNYNYGSRGEAQGVLAHYTQSALIVYYDPANPEHSALDTGIVSRIILFLGAIGLALFLVGFIMRRMDAPDTAAAEDGSGMDGARAP